MKPNGDRPRLKRQRGSAKGFVLTGVVAIISYLTLLPLLYLLWGTFIDEGGITLRHFEAAYTSVPLGELVRNSAIFSIGSTVVATTVGTLLAFLLTRTNVPFKGIGFILSLVPLLIPGLLTSVAWVLLLSPRTGAINVMIEPIVGPEFFNIFSIAGMIFVEGLDLTPLAFLLMVAAFRGMDPALEESAMVSGASLWTVVRRVTLPLVLPGLYAATLILVVRSLESFETPAVLGIPNGNWVFTSRIWDVLRFPPDYGQAGALALSLIFVTILGVYLYSRLSKRARSFQTVTGRGYRPAVMDLGRKRWLGASFIAIYALIAVVGPMIIIIYMSTQPFYTTPSLEGLSRISWDAFEEVIGNSLFTRALTNSLLLGIAAATVVMFLTAIGSWLVVRTRLRGRWLLDSLTFIPITIPGIVLGVSLLFMYLRNPLPIYGSLWILLIAYCTKYLPYGMRYSSGSMFQVSTDLEESAMVSGASWWTSMRRIVLPLLKPGLLAGWMYVVLVAVRELSSSILVYSPGSEVLSVIMWQHWEHGQLPELAALGLIMIAIMTVILVIARSLGAKVGVREG